MALQGHLASVKVQSSAIAMTDEATTTSDNISYQITNSAKRIMDLNTTVVVEDSAVLTTENYRVDYLNGTIIFDTATSRTITVTGAYVTPTTAATARSYSITTSRDVLENTPFNTGFRTYQAGLLTGTASLERFHVTDDLFIDQLLNGEYKIIEFYVDATDKVSFYGLPSNNNIDSPVEGLIMENLDFQITNQIEV